MHFVPLLCPWVAYLALFTNILKWGRFLHFSMYGHKIYIHHGYISWPYLLNSWLHHTPLHNGVVIDTSRQPEMQPASCTSPCLHIVPFPGNVHLINGVGCYYNELTEHLSTLKYYVLLIYQTVLLTVRDRYPHRPEYRNMCPFTVREFKWTKMPWKWYNGRNMGNVRSFYYTPTLLSVYTLYHFHCVCSW